MYNKIALTLCSVLMLGFLSNALVAQSGTGIVESIYFKPASAVIGKKYLPVLNGLTEKIASDSFIYIRIFAFTDTAGSENYNDALSEKRAMAVYNYLNSRSRLDTSNSYVTWLGESNDVYDLHFTGVHAQQRCVDIWISFYKRKK